MKWINANNDRKEKYGNCLSEIEMLCKSVAGTKMKSTMNANLQFSASTTLLATLRLQGQLKLDKGQKKFEDSKVEKLLNSFLSAKIKLGMGTCDDICIAFFLKFTNYRTSDHSLMSGHIYF